jgi:hypothetical protein
MYIDARKIAFAKIRFRIVEREDGTIGSVHSRWLALSRPLGNLITSLELAVPIKGPLSPAIEDFISFAKCLSGLRFISFDVASFDFASHDAVSSYGDFMSYLSSILGRLLPHTEVRTFTVRHAVSITSQMIVSMFQDSSVWRGHGWMVIIVQRQLYQVGDDEVALSSSAFHMTMNDPIEFLRSHELEEPDEEQEGIFKLYFDEIGGERDAKQVVSDEKRSESTRISSIGCSKEAVYGSGGGGMGLTAGGK